MRSVSLLRAVIILLAASLAFNGSAFSQTLTPPPDGITVIGQGQASASPDSTLIQISLAGGDMYGQPVMLQPGATPGAGEREAIQPVLDALANAGVAESSISVVTTPFVGNANFGMYGPSTALIEVTLDDPTSEAIAGVISAVTIGAGEARMPPPAFNVMHRVDDCSALEREARQAAFEDATRLANMEADITGLTLGDVVAVRDSYAVPTSGTDPFMGFSADGSCTAGDMSNAFGPFGPMPYDMSKDPEVVVYAATEVTFAIESAATPAS